MMDDSGQNRVLLIEDDIADIRIFTESLQRISTPINIKVSRDGTDALEIINEFKPKLIFLDLNLPKCAGTEILKKIKGRDESATIPVVVMTTSDSPNDLKNAYQGSANSYVKKPAGIGEFTQMLDTTIKYWFQYVTLPH